MTIEDNWGDLKILDISQDHGNVKDGTIDDYDYHNQHPSHHHHHHPHLVSRMTMFLMVVPGSDIGITWPSGVFSQIDQ